MKPDLFINMRFVIRILLFTLMPAPVFGQSRTITGTIVDENGEALSGVTAALEDPTRGVTTGFDAHYSISTYS
jgi:iron complex outermembrane receptor protein